MRNMLVQDGERSTHKGITRMQYRAGQIKEAVAFPNGCLPGLREGDFSGGTAGKDDLVEEQVKKNPELVEIGTEQNVSPLQTHDYRPAGVATEEDERGRGGKGMRG